MNIKGLQSVWLNEPQRPNQVPFLCEKSKKIEVRKPKSERNQDLLEQQNFFSFDHYRLQVILVVFQVIHHFIKLNYQKKRLDLNK